MGIVIKNVQELDIWRGRKERKRKTAFFAAPPEVVQMGYLQPHLRSICCLSFRGIDKLGNLYPFSGYRFRLS